MTRTASLPAGHRLAAALFLIVALAAAWLGAPARAEAATFNPALIVSDENMRAYDSMSVADIQAFLDANTGPLKSMSFPRHDGGPSASAAVIIYEACRAYNISPKIMLVLLQKEQSLITRTSLAPQTLNRAIGAGCPNSYTNKYPGFGNQMWNGARLLDGYGEGKSTSYVALYYSGIRTWDIYQSPKVAIYPGNIATYKLYTYNPSIGAKTPYGDLSAQSGQLSGNANFWKIYWSWFGDPFADPAVKPVYRFQNRKTGSLYYTSSYAQRVALVKRSSKTFKYKGVAFSVTTSPTTETVPIYAFLEKKSGGYRYTASAQQKDSWRKQKKRFTYKGVGFHASTSATGTVPVYYFLDTKAKSPVYVTTESEKRAYSKAKYRKRYRYKGIAFFIKPR